MDKEIVLTPEELYYLGKILQAKYIDYAYVAAMDDIGQNYSLFEKETGASLVSKGLLLEDFSGRTEISSNIMELLQPVFFGETETSIDICELGEKNSVTVMKYHFYDGAITMVTGKEKKLLIKKVDQFHIQEMISALVPENREYEPEIVADLPREKITRFFALKSIHVGKTSVVKTYIEADGKLYREKDAEHIESVPKETFVSDAYDIVKGA